MQSIVLNYSEVHQESNNILLTQLQGCAPAEDCFCYFDTYFPSTLALRLLCVCRITNWSQQNIIANLLDLTVLYVTILLGKLTAKLKPPKCNKFLILYQLRENPEERQTSLGKYVQWGQQQYFAKGNLWLCVQLYIELRLYWKYSEREKPGV